MPSSTVFKGTKAGVPTQGTVQRPDELKGDQVLVRITASGLCGTDLHYLSADMVLGHEGVGVVDKVGPDVKMLKAGDRVGWGYNTGSCGLCYECETGHDVFCEHRELYGSSHPDQGSFGSNAIWREAFLHPIPASLSDVDAAPLQCGGATVFTPLRDVQAHETVAVMGVGGLGHLAIQFAAKMGCRVVVLSGSERKRDEALRLGAHKFVAMKGLDAEGAEAVGREWPISRLLVTTSAQPDWSIVTPMMGPRSRIYPLSVSMDNFEFPYMPLLIKGITVQGSLVATRSAHREMLAFAGVHGIKPITETFPMSESGLRDAVNKLKEGNVFYRAVLVAQ